MGNFANNMEYVAQRGFKVALGGFVRALCCDPTTSGGLLVAVAGIEAARAIAEEIGGVLIGRAYRGAQKEIVVIDEAFREISERNAGFFRE